MKKIALTGKYGLGKFALVDDEDYEELSNYKWGVMAVGYAYTYYHEIIYMHRLILNPPKNKEVDHVDGNKLNNQRQNLRICSSQQNKFNTFKAKKKKSSIYKGVCFLGQYNCWSASIKYNKRRIHLGIFKTEIEAAKIYNQKAKELFGEFAKLNHL